MRLFLAINLPKEIKNYLEDTVFRIEKLNNPLPIKWANFKDLHLTMGFIENITQDKLTKLQSLLEKTLSLPTFILALEEPGLFPNEQNPRVVKISLTDNAKQLQKIKDQIIKGKKALSKRYKAKKFITYFQSFSNTYQQFYHIHLTLLSHS